MKCAKLFRNGQSQAVRLPRDFRLPGREVFITSLDGAVILLPKRNPWAPLLASLCRFSPDFGGSDNAFPLADESGRRASAHRKNASRPRAKAR
ncbi:MAG: AbrB/MazE/SpoVT family DNA-binding domain-containing protein [Planctomycetota bacterium]|nr:AbrB/MazE/SpoVT family DNA-binding domain-containing protein [Planctomycetota bacterium]